MNLYLDNIIFSLQNHGGISVVWYELLNRILNDSDISPQFIDFKNENVLRQELDISYDKIINNNLSAIPIKLQRYLNPTIKSKKGIFHSSYFRITSNSDIANITTVHDFTYEYFFKGFPKIIHHQQKGNAIKNSKKLICVSQNTKEDLLKFYPHVNEDDVRVVYNGVSDDYKPLTVSEKKDVLELIPFQIGEYVLYVGDRKCSYKNFKMLVEACRIAKSSLVIVGGGNLNADESLFLTEKLGRTRFVQVTGMSNLQLNLLYNCAVFFVYPSFYEGFGIPIIEAQRACCPVICSNKSSIPEVAGNGAIIIDNITERKIADILIDNRSRSNTNEIVNLGAVNSQRFSWDKCYEQTKQIYSEVYSFID